MDKKEAFEKVYELTFKPLTKFISKKLGRNQHLVDDIFQETIIAAYKSYHTFEHKSTYLTWLCRIALNKIADYYRKTIHEDSQILCPLIENFDLFIASDISPEEEAHLFELKRNIRKCINLLPLEYRNLVILHYIKDYSYERIAEVTGSDKRSIEGKLYRARTKLRKLLATSYPEYS